MKRVLVTRPEAQNKALVAALIEQGFQPVILPLLDILPFTKLSHPEESLVIERVVNDLDHINHAIFVSTNAVDCAFNWIKQLPANTRWYPIGEATAKVLARYVPQQEVAGKDMDSETLLNNPFLQDVAGQRVVIFRGQGGREFLAENLRSRGAQVEFCALYERRFVRYEIGTLQAILAQKVDFLQATSTETIQALLEQAIIENLNQAIFNIPLIVPGKRVAQFAIDQGFTRVLTSENAGLIATMDVLKNHNN